MRKVAAALISTILCTSILFSADYYLHRKHGVNFWGYRGPILGRKQPGEKRVAVLGGSTTWGFGLQAGQDFPAQLARSLNQNAQPATPEIKVLNLGFNGDGAYSLKYTLKDYAYLEYDEVVLYTGYNDLGRQNLYDFRRRSPVFGWTGYLPLLPALTVDKLAAWKQQLSGQNERIVFRPPEASQNKPESLSKQVGSRNNENQEGGDAPSMLVVPAEWQFYCDQVSEAVRMALQDGKRVLIVTEPYISDQHVAQQRSLEATIKMRFPNQPHLRYLNLGRAVDLRDKSLCWDGMHLTEEGNRRIAAALSQPVFDLLRN
jgi:lysophospholipase L1-like esterase